MSKKQKKSKQGGILVPVDFSECSEHALEFAGWIASGLGMPITVLHVVHDPGEAPGHYSVRGRKKQLRRMEEVATEMLKSFIDATAEKNQEVASLQELEGKLVVGLPVTRILEVIESIGPTLVIMGSHGRTGLSRMLLGSKAERVVRASPVPVLIVKMPGE
jgi:nucleotide-binding universal stress UspA family protein